MSSSSANAVGDSGDRDQDDHPAESAAGQEGGSGDAAEPEREEGEVDSEDIRDSGEVVRGAEGEDEKSSSPVAAEKEEESRDENVKEAVKTADDEAKEGSVEADAPEEADKGSGDAEDGEVVEETVHEKQYSTRNRSTDHAHDPLERLADALGDLGREKEHTSASLGASFLSDSLTEEERRTRTRYLPDVDGIHVLRKNEVKGDMVLARSIISSTGAVGMLASSKSKGKRARSDEDAMDVEQEEEPVPSEDDVSPSDIVRMGSRTVEVCSADLVLPSAAFVAPSAQQAGSSNDGDGSGSSKRTPREIESVTAFNPPRPPESVGAKKKHRMLRWERRPADIEIDLSNYRKTVHRTRQELKKAERELEKIETEDNHLRRHYFCHLQCLNQEWSRLSEELAGVQKECVNAADLLTSRTRSRGAGKGSYVMRDVLTVLRSRGAEIKEKGLSLDAAPSMKAEQVSSGIGGVSAVSFKDWDYSTVIKPAKVAHGWILPGDRVQSPYGEGTVIDVYPSSLLNPKDTSRTPASPKTEGGRASGSKESPPEKPTGKGLQPSPGTRVTKKDGDADDKSLSHQCDLAPRASVRLPFGIGYFSLDALVSKEDPSCYSDVRLAQKWKGMLQTAQDVGGTVDIEAMADFLSTPSTHPNQSGPMDVDGERSNREVKRRLLPFGAGMLPTSCGRSCSAWNSSLGEVRKAVTPALCHAHGILGKRDNKGVPKSVREEEDLVEENLDLQAKVRQLRNRLCRQRRIRLLNERTYSSTKERSSRIESLVSEMRADLKSLRSRLDEEIRELGISDAQAESILTSYYESLDSQDIGEDDLRQKRLRTLSEQEYDEEEVEEEGLEEQMEATTIEEV